MPKTTHKLKPFYLDGQKLEIGLDEAGKGSYFSRVYAGAVLWDPEITSPLIRDSKELGTHRKRMIAYDFIKEHAPAYGVGWAEVEEIDRININQANIQAMYRAIRDTKIITDNNLSKPKYDKVILDYMEENKEEGWVDDWQALRNLAGGLTEHLTEVYDKTEAVAVLFYVDKGFVSSLFGDFMNHNSCKIELFGLLNMSTGV